MWLLRTCCLVNALHETKSEREKQTGLDNKNTRTIIEWTMSKNKQGLQTTEY